MGNSSSNNHSTNQKQFARLIADARHLHGTALFADVATLDAVSRCPDSLLNPHCGALANDVLDYHLRPLVRVPHLVVCGFGGNGTQTQALPLSAASTAVWVRLKDNRADHSSVVVREGELLLTGGYSHDCSSLSSRTGRWRDGPSMPTKRAGHCAAQLGGVSVVCAGKDESDNTLTSTDLLPAGDAAQWVQGCEMTTARSYAGGAVVAAADASAHRMMVAGGWDSNHHPLDACELYDAVSDRWSVQDARLPQAMRCLATPIAGGSAVLAVDVQWDDEGNTQCALFDVRSNSPSWQPMASTLSARSWHAIAAIGEFSVVMLGGEDADFRETDTAQLYDVRADRWSERAEWSLCAPSAEHCAAVIE